MAGGKPNPRTRARRLALQGLYEWQLSGNPPAEIATRALIEKQGTRLDVAYFQELMREVPKHVAELDTHIAPLLSRPFDEVDPVEKSVLRLGAYELAHHPEIPYRVVINEAVELAKTFGAEQGHRFINGIMDRLAASLREVEVRAGRG